MIEPRLRKIASGFRRHLQSYDAAAIAQRQIADCLATHIAKASPCVQNILELGHGTGFLTRHLLTLQPQSLWLNDLAMPLPDLKWPKMVSLHALAGDAQQIEFPQQIDLVCTSSMTQWLSDPTALFRRAFAALRPGGHLAISSFAPDNFPELSRLGLTDGAPSYQDAASLCQSLPPNGQIVTAFDQSITLSFASAHALLAHLRATGVNGLCGGRLRSTRLRALMRELDQERVLNLTYRPSYCIARKL